MMTHIMHLLIYFIILGFGMLLRFRSLLVFIKMQEHHLILLSIYLYFIIPIFILRSQHF